MYRLRQARPSPAAGLRGALLLNLAFTLLVWAPAPLDAQHPGRGRGGVNIDGVGGIYIPEDLDFRVGESGFQLDDNRNTFGARIGYTFLNGLFLEGSFGYVPLRFTRANVLTNLNTFMFDAAVGYNLRLAPGAYAFGLGGIGGIQWLPTGMPSDESVEALVGVGVRYYVTESLALRAEIRDHIVPKTLNDLRERFNPNLTFDDQGTHNFEISAGLSFFMPVNRDSDRDRVPDRYDDCPGTPAGVATDGSGCPLDSDEDGVPNFRDSCPVTPPGIPVTADGCVPDGDEDGVRDELDRCPATPAGAPVDESGCVLDTDGDGLRDGLDLCPGTPAGAPVDEEGCALDGDGDGVHDGIDSCPNTTADREVNEEGCSRIEVELREGRLVLSSVQFAPGSAQLQQDSRRILDEVGRALVALPEVSVEIQGHTDSSGSAVANMELSEARAQAVFEYLIASFPGLDPDRFVVRGWGESQPIASNATAAGRAQNRRVEFLILER